MESRKQLTIRNALKNPLHCEKVWASLWKAKRKTFLIKSGLDWFELVGLGWLDYCESEREALLNVLAEFPEPGPMMGLVPEAGRFEYFTLEEAYANYREDENPILRTARREDQQALVIPVGDCLKPKKSKIIDFEKYRRKAA